MVLSELVEQLDDQALVKVAPLVRLPDVQRLGYLLDSIDESKVADLLSGWLRARRPRPVRLQLGEPAKGDADNRWLVQPNVELELDL
jgi:hypothetical protein